MAGSDGISLSISQFSTCVIERISINYFRVKREENIPRSIRFHFFRAFPGIFGNQAEQLTQIIHQIFFSCLNDQETKVRYTAATALAAYLKHNCDNTQLFNIYRDCLPFFLSVRFVFVRDQ